MKRTITVKGVGTAKTKPDRIVITMTLEAKDPDYERAMGLANAQIDQLTEAVVAAGFDKCDLKTTSFDVRMNYEGVQDEHGNYRSVFDSYACCHDLKLAFDFANDTLSRTLTAIAACEAKPQFNIAFTVKEPSAVKEKLLISAAENAKQKAKLLCAASGVRLGELVNIDYNWGEVNVFSNTRLLKAKNEAEMANGMFDAGISPEDITSSDSVTFTWEIC